MARSSSDSYRTCHVAGVRSQALKWPFAQKKNMLSAAAPASLNERVLEDQVWSKPRSKSTAKPKSKKTATPKLTKGAENDLPRAKSSAATAVAADTGKRSSKSKKAPAVLGNKNGRSTVVLGPKSNAAQLRSVCKTPSAAACKRSLLAEAAANKAEFETLNASSPATLSFSPALAEAETFPEPVRADVPPAVRTPLAAVQLNTTPQPLPEKTLRTPLTRARAAAAKAAATPANDEAVSQTPPAAAAGWWQDEWGRPAPGCDDTVVGGRGSCESPLDEERLARDEDEEAKEDEEEVEVYESIRARIDESLLCS